MIIHCMWVHVCAIYMRVCMCSCLCVSWLWSSDFNWISLVSCSSSSPQKLIIITRRRHRRAERGHHHHTETTATHTKGAALSTTQDGDDTVCGALSKLNRWTMKETLWCYHSGLRLTQFYYKYLFTIWMN